MGNTLHGAKIKCQFAGVTIAVMQSITTSEDYGLVDVRGFGDFIPIEIAALIFTGNFNFTTFVLSTDKIKDLQFGEREGKTVEAITKEILEQEGFDIVVENKYTGNNVATIAGCKVGTLGMTFTQGAISQRNGSGKYGKPVVTP